jgi:endothelin-converting enzyme/putative endopeptidase
MFLRILLPLAALPVLALAADNGGIDAAAMNPSVNPCVNFYQYACGNWIAQHPLPADRARFGRFTELSDHNQTILLDILQGAAVAKPGRSAIDQKIGDFYASCMDTAAIDKNGFAKLKPALDRINSMASQEDVGVALVLLHRMGIEVLFTFAAQPDAKDSSRTIATLGQGGLSLPDRDSYLKTDPKSVEARQHFVEHVAKMFQLSGDPADAAATKAKMVLEFETILAKASADRVSMRDPNKRYHMMSVKELSSLAPWDWQGFFNGVGAPAFDQINVSNPDFIKQIGANVPYDSADPWKAYFGYHLLRTNADQLSSAFEKENFDFWQRYLNGAQQPRPRNIRCVTAVDRSLGDLLGQRYIELTFGSDAKQQITQLVDALDKALAKDIETLPWMTAETKRAALEKLKAIARNVGAPLKWRDYGKVTVSRDDFLGNTERSAEAAFQRRLDRIGKPTDRTEWTMTTPTVNAFYNPPDNTINFPAGILQPPFFDPKRDIALNYGAIGAVIGHEMTHGFDDQGRKYDGKGNVRDWWTAQDAAEFEKRAACISNEYGGFTSVDDVKLNGRLTLGENSADNGGIRVALMALRDTLKGKQEVIGGFTPEQRFFLGFAQIWCENNSPQSLRQQALTNPHSPGQFRVNGTLQNMPEFQKAFSCKADQPMVSANACRVW